MSDTERFADYTLGARRVFFGFLMILLDIRIIHIDIFPDFIGYILIGFGLERLSHLENSFGVAKGFAWILIATSLVDLVESPEMNLIGGLEASFSTLVLMVVNAVSGVLRLFMVFYICQGIIKTSETHLADLAQFRLRVFLVINSLVLVIYPFTLNVPESYLMPFILLSLPAVLFAEILIITLIRRYSNLLALKRDEISGSEL